MVARWQSYFKGGICSTKLGTSKQDWCKNKLKAHHQFCAVVQPEKAVKIIQRRLRRIFFLNQDQSVQRRTHMESMLRYIKKVLGVQAQRLRPINVDGLLGLEQQNFSDEVRHLVEHSWLRPRRKRTWKTTRPADLSLALTQSLLLRTLGFTPQRYGLEPGDLVLILEDDVLLEPNWMNALAIAIQTLPASWLVARVGWAPGNAPGPEHTVQESQVNGWLLPRVRLVPLSGAHENHADSVESCPCFQRYLYLGLQGMLLETGRRSQALWARHNSFLDMFDNFLLHEQTERNTPPEALGSFVLHPQCMVVRQGIHEFTSSRLANNLQVHDTMRTVQ